jgi:aryl-alcohol dehydrogenase-like predicted oxidoreductase
MIAGHVGEYHRPRCKLCVLSESDDELPEELIMFTRTLGRSGLQVSALGLGTWAIGGPFTDSQGQPRGWGQVDDAESVRAIHRALDLGVTFWDTADVYGTGHSEKLLGLALSGRRGQVVIATKFGRAFEEGSRQFTGSDASPEAIVRACEASLCRLNTDVIDLYQLHLGDYDPERAVEVRETLEDLVRAGKIRYYGWSTDDPERARIFAEGEHCTAVQFRLNLFERNDAMLALCAKHNLAAIIRRPLGQGLLTGKFTADSRLPADDVRHDWDFTSGEQAVQIARLEQLRALLTRDGRSLAQAALGWLWAVSAFTIPIPGFKTVAQVEDNAGALDYGPLSERQVAEIEALLAG